MTTGLDSSEKVDMTSGLDSPPQVPPSSKISGSPHPSISLSGLGRERKVVVFLFLTTIFSSDVVNDGDIENLLGPTLFSFDDVFRIGEMGGEDASQGKSSSIEDAVDVDEKVHVIGTLRVRLSNGNGVIGPRVELVLVVDQVAEETSDRRFTSALEILDVRKELGIGVR